MIFHVLDPLEGLSLGVDHEGPAPATRDDDAVLSGELVVGQALDVPVADLGTLHHEVAEVKVGAHRDGQLLDLFGDKKWENVLVSYQRKVQDSLLLIKEKMF